MNISLKYLIVLNLLRSDGNLIYWNSLNDGKNNILFLQHPAILLFYNEAQEKEWRLWASMILDGGQVKHNPIKVIKLKLILIFKD